jgi:hypothetical protein
MEEICLLQRKERRSRRKSFAHMSLELRKSALFLLLLLSLALRTLFLLLDPKKAGGGA